MFSDAGHPGIVGDHALDAARLQPSKITARASLSGKPAVTNKQGN